MTREKEKLLQTLKIPSQLKPEELGVRLDLPNQDWPWMRQMIIGKINGGNQSKLGLKPHVVFNDIAVPLRNFQNQYLELHELNPNGLDIDDVKRLLPSLQSRTATKVLMLMLRRSMRHAFKQDLFIGSAGWKTNLGFRDNPKHRANTTYFRPHELKKIS